MFDGADCTKRVEDPTLRTLRHARALVARPNGWCQGFAVQTRVMMPTDPLTMPHTIDAHCAYGAIMAGVEAVVGKYDRDLGGSVEIDITDLLPLGSDDLSRWNDDWSRTQADVVALFDRAIEHAIPTHSHLEVIEHV